MIANKAMLVVYGVGALLSIGALTLAYHWAYTRGYDAAEAKAAEVALEAASKFAVELAVQQEKLVIMGDDLEVERARAQQTRTLIKEVYRDNPEARAWADMPLPAAVIRVLDQNHGHTPVPADPGVAARGVP